MKKRANISVTLLVIMAFALVSMALVSFYLNSRGVKEEIKDVYFLNKLYSSELEKESEIYFKASEVLFNNYVLALGEGSIEEANSLTIEKINGILTNYNFIYAQVSLSNGIYNFSGELNEPLIGTLTKNKFWKGGIIEKEDIIMGVIYRPQINFKIYFEREGLNSYEAFFNSLDKCRGVEEVEKCLSVEINLFNINYDKNTNIVSFESKRHFFRNGEIKPLTFEVSLAQDL